MAVKIAAFKGHPLLQPPVEDSFPEWLKVSVGDRSLMRKALQEKRSDRIANDVMWMRHYLRGLGLRIDEAPADEELVRSFLSSARKKRDGHEVSRILELEGGRTPGVGYQASDKGLFDDVLADCRRRHYGFGLATIHSSLMAIGAESHPPDEDMKILLEDLQNEKTWTKIKYHYLLRALGVASGFTEDAGLLKGMVESARASGDGYGLSQLLHDGRVLFCTEGGVTSEVRMPPLKRFRSF